MPAPSTLGNLQLGVSALERFVKAYPQHKLAAQAEFDIAQGDVQHGRHDRAIAQLKALIGNAAYAKAKQVADARKHAATTSEKGEVAFEFLARHSAGTKGTKKL